MEQLVAVPPKLRHACPASFTNFTVFLGSFGSPGVPPAPVLIPAKREFVGMNAVATAELGGWFGNGFAKLVPGRLTACCTKKGGPRDPCRKFWLESRWK